MERRRLRITGTVQGVGFRPHLHRLASDLGLSGVAGNDDDGVWCEVQGPPARLDAFAYRLVAEAPPLARIEATATEPTAPVDGEDDFRLAASVVADRTTTATVPADVAPCRPCLTELRDPTDRRHRHPFICCVDCGPRYTVVDALPYDRRRTSMADFEPCRACAAEFADPADRRFHAQAICCPDCGPALALTVDGVEVVGDPVDETVARLRGGAIVAVKGVGGYQLVCRADHERAVTRLRSRKHREEKPFALLVGSVDDAGALVDLDRGAIEALTGVHAPIVLAPRRVGSSTTGPVAEAVAPDTGLLGVMLPASPLHALLVDGVDGPLVCTSGNRSDEPIVIDDADVGAALGRIADAVLSHDRRIARRADDSIGQTMAGRFQVLRRARGVTTPLPLPSPGPTVLGVGAELKSTVGLALGPDAHLSVHLGDLEHPAALAAFETAVADLLTVTRTGPELVVHDLHPEYLSTKFATAVGLAPTLGVQHHHAHLAACLADNGHPGPAIGVVFDGLGWGEDGTAWGGEFLVGDAASCRRAAHLAPVPMPGGAAAIRHPWRMAVAHLATAFGPDLPDLALLRARADELPAVLDQATDESALVTSSVGRLFDAVAALCGLVATVTYEGQAAVRLEQAVTSTERRYPLDEMASTDGGAEPVRIDGAPLVRAVVSDLRRGVDVGLVAGGFHAWLADLVVAQCLRLREATGIGVVALSGGVFQNRLLVELVVAELTASRFEVLRHRRVPPNDGGIALGQVAIGRANLAAQQ